MSENISNFESKNLFENIYIIKLYSLILRTIINNNILNYKNNLKFIKI